MVDMQLPQVGSVLTSTLNRDDFRPPRSAVTGPPAQHSTGSGAWLRVNHELNKKHYHQNSDHAFWWQATGFALAILLREAGYSAEDQERYLRLYSCSIVPELGSGPRRDGSPGLWKSFMTDHHCPVEFSWEWNRKDELPTIRFSFEAIGPAAGTTNDPYNEFATMRFVKEHAPEIEGCDMAWFQHLWDKLVSFTEPAPNKSHDQPSGLTHESRSFLALDLNDDSLVLKAYFMPVFKARAMGCSTMDIICRAVETLPGSTEAMSSSYQALMAFLQSQSAGNQLEPEIVATDCLAPSKSRIKIYMRSQSTSLRSVLHILTLGGLLRETTSDRALQEFQKLWCLTLGQSANVLLDHELPPVANRTAGILFYFELSPNKALPAVKVYLPVRHYGGNDRETANRLQAYIRSTSRADYSERYIKAVEGIKARASSNYKQRDLQTYLCAMLDDTPRLTSYLSPVVYEQ